MVLKMAIQQFPNTQLKNYYLFENKIYETQKNLIDKYNLSKKDWQKLLEEKKFPKLQIVLFLMAWRKIFL